MIGSTHFGHIPPVTKNLLIINVLIFAVMAIAGKENVISQYCALHYFSSPLFNPAQLITYMFIHGGFAHLFFNMFALYMFGPSIEWAFGSKRFLFYYISVGIGAALVQEGVFAIMLHKYYAMFSDYEMQEIIDQGAILLKTGRTFADPYLGDINSLVNGGTVGASGAIYGILLAFGMLWPNRELMLLIPPMPIKAKWLVIGYGVLELLLGVSGTASNVAHFCHLGGMLFGFFIILYWKHAYTKRF
ncbi:MAG: rhomboid family intramembrane serine protease [Clostridium sp.]|nr:rhomboid family intramembrane serine protease [Clostridium sp.]